MQTAIVAELQRQGRIKRWLADQLGISPTRLAEYLNGYKEPPANFYERVAVALDVPERAIRPSVEPVESVA